MPLGELPGRMGNFIDAAQAKAKHTFGFDESGLAPEDELYGMNPRRAYWSNALTDLANMTMGQPLQGLAQQGNAAQQQWVEQRKEREAMNQYRELIGQSQLLSAMKPPRGSQPPSIIQEAQYLFPDDQAAQAKYTQDYRTKAQSSVNIDFDQSGPKAYLMELAKNAPAEYEKAIAAQDEWSRYEAMKGLIPQLGNTGNAKEWMTNARSGLISVGMGGAAGFLDALSEAAGADFFSGDQGATELFRALSNQDVLARARELYPVSNKDIDFPKEMSVTLKSMSDPAAMRTMLTNRQQRSERAMGYYNTWVRPSLRAIPEIPELPEVVPYNLEELNRREAELEAELYPNGIPGTTR